MRTRLPFLLFLPVLLGALVPAAAPIQAAGKKPLTYAAWNEWRSIQGTSLSPDGQWVVYTLAPQEGDAELVARHTESEREHRHARGTGAEITADSRHALFTVVPAKADVEKAQKEKRKPEEQPKNALGVMGLASGKVTTVEGVRSFRVVEESGAHAAVHLEAEVRKDAPAEKKPEPAAAPAKPEAKKPEAKKPEEKKKEPGTTLLVRDLGSGAEVRIPEVTDYAWNRDGSWLAYAVSSATPANDGLYARRTKDGASLPLVTGAGNYRRLTWSERGDRLAFLSDRDDYAAKAPAFKLYLWKPGAEKAVETVSRATRHFPEKCLLSENGALRFSKDGERLFLSYAPLPEEGGKKAGERIDVDIWSWKDDLLQPMQKVRAEAERRRAYTAVWRLDDRRLVPLAAPELPGVSAPDGDSWAVGFSDQPYRQLISWDAGYQDVYLVGLKDGKREKVLEKARYGASLSPEGKYLVHFSAEDGAWHARRVKDGRTVNLTGKLGVPFAVETWDRPDSPASYGIAGWTADDRTVLIYDRYDIWEIDPDGGQARMVTGGAGRPQQISFRYVRLDPEERAVPTGTPLLLTATDERTKATGFYRVSLPVGAGPQRLLMLDKALGTPVKAKGADRFLFTAQSFEEYPDLWISDSSFAAPKRLTRANPQQEGYLWGRSELLPYLSTDGKPLQAVVTKPETFQPGQRYPVMVYIYERRSDSLHRYVTPAPGTSINPARYVSNGYVVLQPDIVYDTGYPGESALKCVLPAVQRLVEMGVADPERIGIQGHSWGAYQVNYLITRTRAFRAAQAGASVANMISAYGGIRWGSGMSRAFQYEKTQSRIGGPPWERPLQFIENSPIFWVDKVSTPYLTLHNDGDGAVPWYQGIEFFTALRRLGKEAYLFNYNGEDHGLRKRANQKHWTVHQDEFFDHFLLGKPRPEWMERGVPYAERGTRDLVPVLGTAPGKE